MTSQRTLTTLFEGGSYFECPRWREDRWWVSDFYRHAVFTYDPEGREQLALEVEAQPSGLGWLPGGDLLVVSMKDRRVLRRKVDGSIATHAELSDLTTGHLNDLVVDGQGRAFVGNFGFDLMAGGQPAPAALVRVDPDGAATIAADDLWFPNGMMITDDGTLIVAETFAARLTAFDIQADGSLANRRAWAQVQPAPEPADTETMLSAVSFAPDGCALDAEGHVWAANALGAAVCHVAPGGRIVEELPMPGGLGVFACGLGGPDGRTLIACAAPDFHEQARAAAREAVLLTTTVEVPHAGLP
ncbi:MAG: SMP-30/gluconolactonase/LRE family protein [Solirubrobacterales bacterium]|nr:SMP-30/gluconolactonase/LRE family protein [Solirubrobacterales bacterium]MBV9714687.1 SMP-30/gluconolactonase/LRE family protein [Solirubrobacterales bacterium]